MSTTCTHLGELARLQPPKLSQSVHREECTQCFDNQDHPLGVDVCLHCFNGGCLDGTRHHARTHAQKAGHAFALNVKRKLKPSSNRPPAKMTKLAIVEEREEDKYEWTTAIRCWKCDPTNGAEIPHASAADASALTASVLSALSSARQSEVKAWEEELTPCEHTLCLEQLSTGPIPASGLAQCGACDLRENLWLCLACGALGCGRAQFGGTGGHGHGLAHYAATGHPVAVKLGTITPEGAADIYCYACDDARTDPELAAHLAAFGISVAAARKTEKSMTELQLEHNLRYDFSLTDDAGKALEPVFGPGLTGLANLGNSCYMASVVQTLFALPAFRAFYRSNELAPSPLEPATHWATCPEALPAACVDCQMLKLADGLLSGRYSHPRPAGSQPQDPLAHASPTPVFQEGVRPASFKALVGHGHAEFATMRQQDAEEFFGHLLSVLRRHARARHAGSAEPTEIFAFGMEQRLQCGACARVRYRTDGADALSVPVPVREKGKDAEGKVLYEDVRLEECVEGVMGAEALEYACPSCAQSVQATKQARFATFPQVLVVHARKFQLVNWVPTKLDIPLLVPDDDTLDLSGFLGRGLQPGEAALPDAEASAPALPALDAEAVAQLEGMGFPALRCQKALLATGNAGAEAAMEWLFAHMDDPDIDAPIQLAGAGAASKPEPSAEQVAMLADMGFTPAQAKKALRETSGNAERAVEWLFSHPDDMGEEAAPAAAPSAPAAPNVGGSTALPARYRLKAFISHKGPSVHSGHYVAHVRTAETGSWVLFNDEKVVRADEESVRELKKLAYLYVFERI